MAAQRRRNNNKTQINLKMKNNRKKGNGFEGINLDDGTEWSNDKKVFKKIHAKKKVRVLEITEGNPKLDY